MYWRRESSRCVDSTSPMARKRCSQIRPPPAAARAAQADAAGAMEPSPPCSRRSLRPGRGLRSACARAPAASVQGRVSPEPRPAAQ